MRNQAHGRVENIISSRNRSPEDLDWGSVDQDADFMVYEQSPLGQTIGVSRPFSPWGAPDEPVSNMFTSNIGLSMPANCLDNGIGGEYDFTASLFASTEFSAESFVYVANTTHTTSDDTFQREFIVTPPSTDHIYSRAASFFSPEPPVFAIDGYRSPALRDNSVEAEQAGPILRSQQALFGLGSMVPQVVPNPYADANNVDYSVFPNGNVLQQLDLNAMGSQMVGPWNPHAAQYGPYPNPGHSSFLPSYGPMEDYGKERNHQREPSPWPAQRLQITHENLPKKRKQRNRRIPAHSLRSESQEVQWEHNFIVSGTGPMRTTREGRQFPHKGTKRGIRIGKMAPEGIKNANEVRHNNSGGACWGCRNTKVKCDPTGICKACEKRAKKNNLQPCCIRIELIQFRDLFFQTEIISHFKESEIKELMNKGIEKFNDPVFEVEVTVGFYFRSIKLVVQTFIPKTEDLMQHHKICLQPDGEGKKSSQLVRNGSAPVGLEQGIDKEDLKQKCSDYIESMISSPHYAAQTTAGQANMIPEKIISVLQQYCLTLPSSNDSLIKLALKLHATDHFQSRIISFIASSTNTIISNLNLPLPSPSEENSQFSSFSSRLLNRQIKYAMHLLHEELNKEVLRRLHDVMRGTKTETSWIESFGTILLLCLCVEEQQIVVDDFVKLGLQKSKDGEEFGGGWGREKELVNCRELDEMIKMFMHLFHEVFGSRKRNKDTNPVRDGVGGVERLGGRLGSEMVEGIKEVVDDYGDEMLELSTPIFTESFSPDEIDLAMRNPGRLASEFLLSFLTC